MAAINHPDIKEKVSVKNKNDEIKNFMMQKEELLFCNKVLSEIGAFVFIFDLNKERFLWLNDYHKKLLGYKINLKKHSSADLVNIFHPEDRNIIDEMKNFFKKKKRGVFTSIYRMRKSKGEFAWVFTNAKLFSNAAEEDSNKVIGVTVDFSVDLSYDKNIKCVLKEKLKKCNNPQIKKVSKRELQIVKLFANGFKSKEIASELDISFHTVNNHRKNILRKLQLRNLASLVNFAVDNGLD